MKIVISNLRYTEVSPPDFSLRSAPTRPLTKVEAEKVKEILKNFLAESALSESLAEHVVPAAENSENWPQILFELTVEDDSAHTTYEVVHSTFNLDGVMLPSGSIVLSMVDHHPLVPRGATCVKYLRPTVPR